jgi:hypothetical protein
MEANGKNIIKDDNKNKTDDREKENNTIINVNLGTILFILGISFVVVDFYFTLSKHPLQRSTLIWLTPVLSFIFIILGSVIIFLNRKIEEYKIPNKPEEKIRSSLENAMARAWEDHHHARNQTWEALKLEAILAVALIGIDLSKINESYGTITVVGSILLFLLSISGIMITLHHRGLEIRKFRHIMHCEDALGLRPYIDGVRLPSSIYIWEIFAFWKSNTVLFIMRMHTTIMIFAIIFFISRV